MAHNALVSLLFLALLSACQNIPGKDDEIRTFEVMQRGVATLNRIEDRNGARWVDFDWQAQNNIDEPDKLRQVELSRIKHLPADLKLAAGDRLPLSVTHTFRQRGTSTPLRLHSEWRFDDSASRLGIPVSRSYRPPHCINQ